MGHILHLYHTHKKNSYQGWKAGIEEAMGLCQSNAERAASRITLDDAGSLTKQWPINQSYLNANMSFEQDLGSPTKGWKALNDVVATVQIDGTAIEGAQVMRVSPSDPTSHHIRQRMNLMDAQGVVVGSTIRHRHTYPNSVSGDVLVQIRVKEVDYPDDCTATKSSWNLEASEAYAPSYQSWSHGSITPSEAYTVPPNRDAIDFDLRMVNRIVDGATQGPISVRVDVLSLVQWTQ